MRLLAVFLIATIIAGFSLGSIMTFGLAQTGSTYKISGYILDSTGKGLSGAMIIFNVPQTVPAVYSDSSGHYEIYVPAGTYHVNVWPPFDSNYIYYDEPALAVGSDTTKNITLASGYKVSGYITDSSGKPVSKAIVSLGNYLCGWYSIASGYYFVTAPAGTYTLKANPGNGPVDAPVFPTYYEYNFVVNGNIAKNITVALSTTPSANVLKVELQPKYDGQALFTSEKVHSSPKSVKLVIPKNASQGSYGMALYPYNGTLSSVANFSIFTSYTNAVPRFLLCLAKNHTWADTFLLSDYQFTSNGDWKSTTGGNRWGWTETNIDLTNYGTTWKSLDSWKTEYGNLKVLYIGIVLEYWAVDPDGFGEPLYADELTVNGVKYNIDPASASTPTPNPAFIAGAINSDTFWTMADSPYIFVGDVTVAPGVKLTINPGVTVDFGSSSLIVNGTLQARGTEADRIKFRSSQQIVGAWPPRIYFTDSSTRWNETAGTGCIIEYAEVNVTNYQYETIRDGYPKISNSIFYNYGNDAAAIYTKGGIISNNTILGGYRGIETEKSEGALILYNVIKDTEGGAAITVGFDTAPTIVGNLLIDNREGITFWNPNQNGPYISNNTLLGNIVGFRFTNYITSPSLGKILYNNVNSTGYNVKVEKTDPQIVVNMTYNWWGTTNTALIDQKIYDQKDDAKLSLVAYKPFLEAPALTGSPEYVPPVPSPSPSPTPTPTPTQSSTQISISVDVSSTLVGATVNVKGRLLDTNATPLQGRLIILSYAIEGGGSWVQIGSGTTDFAGGYNIQWVNTGSGTFTLKAEWNGDSNSYSSSAFTTASFLPYENQRQFCVESNSTVTALAFDSATSELTFTVSGSPGTAGYAKVAIAKSLVSNPENLKVYLDGNHVNYAITATEDCWILSFNYLHSSHEVRISTATAQTAKPALQGLTYWVWAAVAAIIVTVVGLGCVVVWRILKKQKLASA